MPWRAANTPPRLMSPTMMAGIPAAQASGRFTMSRSSRLISAGLPAPSQITTSKRSRRSASASSTSPNSSGLTEWYSAAVITRHGSPFSTTWLVRSPVGLSRIGFIATSAGTPAAWAWVAWARPISWPDGVTAELRAMFWPLNGATDTPWRASTRHNPATRVDLPASEVVPQTMARRAGSSRPGARGSDASRRGMRPGTRQRGRLVGQASGVTSPASGIRCRSKVSWLPDRHVPSAFQPLGAVTIDREGLFPGDSCGTAPDSHRCSL